MPQIPNPIGVTTLRIGGTYRPGEIERLCDITHITLQQCKQAASKVYPVERIWQGRPSEFVPIWSGLCARLKAFNNPTHWASWEFNAIQGPQAGSILLVRWNKYALDFVSTPYTKTSQPELEVIRIARHILVTSVTPHFGLVLKRK